MFFMKSTSCWIIKLFLAEYMSIKNDHFELGKSNTTSRTNILNYNICGYIYVYSVVVLIAM